MSEGDRRDYRSLGEILRDAREERGWTVEKLSEITKIAPRMIEALESDDLERISSPVYARGFVRSLSDKLGLDTPWLLSRLEGLIGEMPRPQVASPPPSPTPAVPPPTPGTPLTTIKPLTAGEGEAHENTWKIETVRVRRVDTEGGRPRTLLWALGIVIVLTAVGLLWFLRGTETRRADPAAEARPATSAPGRAGGGARAMDPSTGGEELAGPGTVPAETGTTAEVPPSQEGPSAQRPDAREESGDEGGAALRPDTTATPPVDGTGEVAAGEPAATDGTPAAAVDPEVGQGEEIVQAPEASRGLSSIVRPGGALRAVPMELVIRANARTEVWAAADGADLRRRVLAPGQEWTLTGSDHFSLRLGDPEAVTLVLDGVRRDPPPGLDSEWILYPRRGEPEDRP